MVERRVRGIDLVRILQMYDKQLMFESSYHEIDSNRMRNNLKIKLDGVQSEGEFCNSSVICYVVKANPPPYVMKGGNLEDYGVNKVAIWKNSGYIVRFLTIEGFRSSRVCSIF